MGRTPLRQQLQAVPIASDQCFLFRPRPSFHLPFSGDGIADGVELLRKYEGDGSALCSVAAK
jgi:hypothetical protein